MLLYHSTLQVYKEDIPRGNSAVAFVMNLQVSKVTEEDF